MSEVNSQVDSEPEIEVVEDQVCASCESITDDEKIELKTKTTEQVTFQIVDGAEKIQQLQSTEVSQTPNSKKVTWTSKVARFAKLLKPNLEKKWQKALILFFLILSAQFIFAGYSVVTVLYIKNIRFDIGLLSLVRSMIASVCTIPLALLFEGKFRFFNYDKKTMCYFFFIGLVCSSLSPILFQLSIELTTASFGVIMQQLIPVISFLLSLAFKVEPFPSFKDISFIVKFCGMVLCVGSAIAIAAINFVVPLESINWKRWLGGIVAALMNSVVFAMYLVLQAKLFFLNPNHSLSKKPFTLNCLATIYGTFLYIPLCGIYFFVSRPNLDITVDASIAIMYSAIVMSCVGYSLMILSIKISSPMISSCFVSIQVVSSLLLLKFFADEEMTTAQYIISIGVIGGAIMVVLSPLLKKNTSPKEN